MNKKNQDSDQDETFSISLVDLSDVAKTIQPLEMWSGKKQATSLRPNPENVPRLLLLNIFHIYKKIGLNLFELFQYFFLNCG